MSDVIRPFIAIGSIIAPFIPGGQIIALGLAAVSTGLTLFGRRSSATGIQYKQQAFLVPGVNTTRPLPVIYGETLIAPQWIDMRSGSAADSLYLVGALCMGSFTGSGDIESIDEVYFNDPTNEVLDASGTPQAPYTANNLYIEKHLGDVTQAASTLMTTDFSGVWGANHQGRGVAYAVLKLTRGSTLTTTQKEVYTGLPQPILMRVKGTKVYDTRTDTIIWSENPAMIVRDYLLSTTYGFGFDESELDETSFIDAANYCEEQVSTPGGQQDRYTCNGIVDTGRPIGQNLDDLLSSCSGRLIYENGKLRLSIPQTQTVTSFTITPDNTKGDLKIITAGTNYMVNEVHTSFPNVGTSYAADTVIWPSTKDDPNDFLAADNNYSLVGQLDLPFTTPIYQAQRQSALYVKRSRQFQVHGTFTEELIQAQIGDIVPVTNLSAGWDAEPFEVTAWAVTEDMDVVLGLMHYDLDDYTLAQYTSSATENTSLPSPFTIEDPTNVTLESGPDLDRLRVGWDHPYPSTVDHYEVASRKTTSGSADDYVWRTFDTPSNDEEKSFITGVRHGDTWEARVRAVNKLRLVSNWVTSSVHLAVTHPYASASFGIPTENDYTVFYPIEFGAGSAYVDIWSRQAQTGSLADPDSVEDPVMNARFYAGRVFAGQSGYEIAAMGTAQYIKTKMTAYNSYGEAGDATGSWLNHVQYASLPGPAPSAPTNPSASTEDTLGRIKFSWTVATASAYTDVFLDGSFVKRKNPTFGSHTINGLDDNTTYELKCRHYENLQYSAFTTPITETTEQGQLGAPTLNALDGKTDSTVRLFVTPGDPTTGYVVYRFQRSGSLDWADITVGEYGSGQYIHYDPAEIGNEWYFRVRAEATDWLDSDWSNIDAATYYDSGA